MHQLRDNPQNDKVSCVTRMKGIGLDIELLRTFAAVERDGSFAAVARREGVDPSAVSRRIASLEDALDLRLFDRTTRRLRLTEAGRVYLDRILPLVDALQEAKDAARDTVTVPSGLLRVTTSVAFGERWLTPRLPAFRTAYPKVEIELRLTDAHVDIVAEGIDLAVRLGPRIEGTLVSAKLFDTPYRAVAAPGYLANRNMPKAPEDLSEHQAIRFALPRFGNAWRFRKAPDSEEVKVTPASALAISNALAVRRAALDGLGVALLADWTVADDIRKGRLVDVLPGWEASATDFATAAWIVYPTRDYVPARLRAFIDHLRASRKGVSATAGAHR